MPGGDGTGPLGRGPLTGRGLGPCARFLAFGRDFGFRRRNFTPASPSVEAVTLSKKEQKKILEAELKEIETEKKEIEKKLKELK